MTVIRFLIIGLCVLIGVHESRAFPCAEVGLVLAIDASGSISGDEFRFQTQGTAQALKDPAVVTALLADGPVAISAVIWGDAAEGTQVIDWAWIRSADDIDRFAHRLATLRRFTAGNTDIGQGLWQPLDRFDRAPACFHRRIIDLSGDGRESIYPKRRLAVALAVARERAERMGVTINALAITSEDADLAQYYRQRLITGPNAFVLEAKDAASFVATMTRKLIKEIDADRRIAALELNPGR